MHFLINPTFVAGEPMNKVWDGVGGGGGGENECKRIGSINKGIEFLNFKFLHGVYTKYSFYSL